MTVVLSYGMGVDSTAILLRWLEDPASRPCELEDLVVLTAQTGAEFKRTGELVERHVLPRLRAAGIRFVEIARATGSQRDGVEVLQDTRSPERIHLDGAFTLADELLAAGTMPTSAGSRKCSLKAKGWGLDLWIESEFGGQEDLEVVIGFNLDEGGRARRGLEAHARKGATGRLSFPLLDDWAWDYATAGSYIEATVGEAWEKSACTFCPFARDRVAERFENDPTEAVLPLVMETVAVGLNPRLVGLYKTRTLRSVLEAAGNLEALSAAERELQALPWALYRVRRVFEGNWSRCLEIVDQGTREELEAKLAGFGRVQVEDGISRVWEMERHEDEQGTVRESFLAVLPATAAPKVQPIFFRRWGVEVRRAA